MINYLAKFIPNLSSHTVNLRKLLEKDSMWYFDAKHRKEVDILKTLVTKPPVLKLFNPDLPIKISCDASMKGLGSVLEQKHQDTWYPIAYASRSLTPSEQNYCQLEKEILSIVFSCEKFHDFIYGKKFYIFNDHLPLKSIFKKSILKAPPRIQKFLLRLQRYQFEMHYIKGSLLTVADTLSRAALSDKTPEIEESEINCYVHLIESNYLISDYRLQQFKDETNADVTLQTLLKFIQNGWPNNRNQIPETIRPYYTHRQDLTYSNGIIFKDVRIVVPKSLRNDMKHLLHTGHLGIVKIKNRARDIIYWPGINSDIENIVNSCEICQEHQNRQRDEPPIKHDIPTTPWTKVGTDIFHLRGKPYLAVVDYTTNFFDISLLPDKLSETVVKHTKRIFSKYGIPKKVVSDNGPEFIGKAYRSFSKLWDFKHIKSSPRYPKSNGQIERTIQTIKKTLKKVIKSNEDPYLALLALRTSAGPNNNTPPATLFYNRTIRTLLPSVSNSTDIRNKKIENQHVNNSQQSKKALPKLHHNDPVRLHDGKNWSINGKIIEQLDQPNSYLVKTNDDNNILKRNRKHILLKKGTDVCQNSNMENDEYPLINFENTNILDQPIANEANNELSNPMSPNRTRSGRIVRRPIRYEDYIT